MVGEVTPGLELFTTVVNAALELPINVLMSVDVGLVV